MPREARGLGAQEMVAPGGRVDEALLGEESRPVLGRDLQEIEGDLEITRVVVGRQPIDRLPADAGDLHVVDEARQIRRELGRVGGRGGDEDGVVRAEVEELAADAPPPGERQPGQRQPARQARDRRRQKQPLGVGLERRIEEVVLLVDVADRQDARQDGRAAAEPLDQRLAERPHRAAGRQEHGRIGERQRIADAASGARRPETSASASAGRNGAPAGMVKTRGRRGCSALMDASITGRYIS